MPKVQHTSIPISLAHERYVQHPLNESKVHKTS